MLSAMWPRRHAAPGVSRGETRIGLLLIGVLTGLLILAVLLPLTFIFGRAVLDRQDRFVGLANLWQVLDSPGLMRAAMHSLSLALVVCLLAIPLAFAMAWGLTHARVPCRTLWRQIGLSPLLTPSLLPGISLVYLFGNQGPLKDWMPGGTVYGFWGMVLGELYYTFPYALLILSTAMAAADGRLYEAGRVLGAGPLRRFLTITLPSARYGLASATLVVATLVMTDFGVPILVGGDVDVLAVEAYKQVIGQQNFPRGAVIGLMLLLPALLSFLLEQRLARRQQAALTARAVPYAPVPRPGRDRWVLLFLCAVSAGLLGMLAVGVGASLIRYWPYNLAPTLLHYQFGQSDGGGWAAYGNSLAMAGASALFGTALVFLSAYACEKMTLAPGARAMLRCLAMLPMAVPGLVLGLGYVFFFNHPANPLNGLYGSLALMVVCTIAHFYSTAHLTLATALKQLDREFEAVAASLKVPFWLTMWRVTLPVCLPALVDVARFFFVSAMTTLSALIFLMSPAHSVAAVSIITLDETGDTAAAAAMATLVVLTSAAASLLSIWLERRLAHRTQRWRAG
ncbi:putative 2-aminoethylphosphonate ABC transporter permease subunit [Paludibacterium purpuratum]|uniref:Iron(III) transport system permease protein n=1 Tax=Paludibacterium purpuratum TaxID=1144873 RepID=A0A4V3DW23_9NEIS|nr:putative 2-aminoethylphosphonate ABC transporter permease subunit [Paludibacterium purpuratum]TDR82989.1 iron(III) transport system permease protein [Paludibacterium purpuratum]